MSRPAALAAATVAAAASAHLVPSVVSLGQWLPARATPGGWCTWRGSSTAVALTFDDGPDPATTPAVLDRLDALGVSATFFMLGDAVARHPGLAAEVAARGHAVGTHGHRHRHHLGSPPWWPGADLDRALAATAEATGARPRWFRPPYGQCSGATLAAARRRGLRTALWSAWGREWVDTGRADRVAARVGAALAPGAIVLLHDADTTSPVGTAATATAALDRIVADARAAGLEPVTLDALVGVAA